MPRLLGKQSNNSWYATLALFLVIVTAGLLEYIGIVNVLPGFGWDRPLNNQALLQSSPRD